MPARTWAGASSAVSALPARVAASAVLALGVALLLTVAACGGGATAADTNEPNDGLEAATPLTAGYPLEGVLTAGDSDVFGSEAPAGAGAHAFVVTVVCGDPPDLEVDVGASIPGAWEGITWPGWEPAVSGDHLTVAGELPEGTVLVFVRGVAGTRYTVAITWE